MRTLLAILLLACAAMPAHAVVIHVKADGSGDVPTIAAAYAIARTAPTTRATCSRGIKRVRAAARFTRLARGSASLAAARSLQTQRPRADICGRVDC